jgi:hypothetical protein
MDKTTDAIVDSSPTPIEDNFYPEKKSPDVKPASSPDTSEAPDDSKDNENSGAAKTEAASEPAEEEQEPLTDKSKSPRSSWAEMRQARYRAEAEIEFLKKQLDERKRASTPAEPPADPNKPKSEQFETWDEFLDARDKYNRKTWETEQVEKQRLAEEAKAKAEAEKESAKHLERFEARERVVQAKSPDYQSHFDRFFERAQSIPPLRTAVFESEIAPDLADYLGGHPEELSQIAGLQPGAIWKAIGKLEDKLSSEKGSPTPITRAPRPLADVSGNAGRALKELSFEEKLYGANT